MPAQKYKLSSVDPSSGEAKVCAFFQRPEGCRNGDNCKFLHSEVGAAGAREQSSNAAGDTASVVSSESEEETEVVQKPQRAVKPKAKAEKATPTKNKKAKAKKPKVEPVNTSMDVDDGAAAAAGSADDNNDDYNPFLSPKSKTPTARLPTPASKKKRKAKEVEHTPAASDAAAAAASKSPAPQRGATPKSGKETPKKKKARKEKPTNAKPASPAPVAKSPDSSIATDFRNFASALPVAAFTIPGVTTPAVPVASGANAVYSKESKTDNVPLPKSTDVGRKWQKTVLKTREHPRYAGTFDWDKCKKTDEDQGVCKPSSWIKAKPFGKWCENNPQAIAIDCEMCETQDPATGSKNPKALCRLSIVNAEKPGEVLIDTLVKPKWPVTDYRSRINGIKKEHLENVEFTIDHAQAFMMALCSEETVVLGHAVQNDLAALKMEHYCSADSSFLFQASDNPTSSVSLKDLVKTLFSKDMPETHDSVNDARKALECVDYYRAHGGKVPLIERTPRNRSHQLLVHRVPKQLKKEHFVTLFLAQTTIQPTEVEDIEFNGEIGKTHITFKSSKHATLAFDTLDGKPEEDKTKRLQKKIYLKGGGYVRVRMMVAKKPSDHTHGGRSSSGGSNGNTSDKPKAKTAS